MTYSKYLVQRAIELSDGRSAGEILKTLSAEFDIYDLPDERTIRRWCKNKPKSNIEQEHNLMYKYIYENRKEHFEQLALVAKTLLDNDLSSVSKILDINHNLEQGIYILTKENRIGNYDYLTQKQLSEIIMDNITLAEHKYETWFFYKCFLTHLTSEDVKDLKGKGFFDVVKEQPYRLIEVLRIIAARKTFKGTCPVCKDW